MLSRELPSFNVGASCAEGASGNPQVAPCSKDGGPFSVAGCEPDACRSFPINDFKSGYVVRLGLTTAKNLIIVRQPLIFQWWHFVGIQINQSFGSATGC